MPTQADSSAHGQAHADVRVEKLQRAGFSLQHCPSTAQCAQAESRAQASSTDGQQQSITSHSSPQQLLEGCIWQQLQGGTGGQASSTVRKQQGTLSNDSCQQENEGCTCQRLQGHSRLKHGPKCFTLSCGVDGCPECSPGVDGRYPYFCVSSVQEASLRGWFASRTHLTDRGAQMCNHCLNQAWESYQARCMQALQTRLPVWLAEGLLS